MTDQQLLSLFEQGKENEALAYIANNWQPRLCAFIRQKFKLSDVDIEEVLNDTLLKLWQNIKYYDVNRSALRTFYNIIGVGKTIDKIRTNKTKANTTFNVTEEKDVERAYQILKDDSLNMEQSIIYLEYDNEKLSDFKNDNPDCFELLITHFVDGKTWVEIAKEQDKKANTVLKSGNRCLDKIKAFFGIQP
jgi:RNA polymerase sigma factor (sigma-70 family)